MIPAHFSKVLKWKLTGRNYRKIIITSQTSPTEDSQNQTNFLILKQQWHQSPHLFLPSACQGVKKSTMLSVSKAAVLAKAHIIWKKSFIPFLPDFQKRTIMSRSDYPLCCFLITSFLLKGHSAGNEDSHPLIFRDLIFLIKKFFVNWHLRNRWWWSAASPPLRKDAWSPFIDLL